MRDEVSTNEAVAAKVALLQRALEALDGDLAKARTALAIGVHELFREGAGDPAAAEPMNAALDLAVGTYIFDLDEALAGFRASAPGPTCP